MQRYFIDKNFFHDTFVLMPKEDAYHMSKVMRMKIGDQVMICNEEKGSFLGSIMQMNGDEIKVSLVEKIEENTELPLQVTIAQGLVRREKQEEVIQKLTALGATTYIPIFMRRSVVKVIDEKLDKRQQRLQKIVKEASEQSRRTKLMRVAYPLSFFDLLKTKDQYDALLYAYEEEISTSSNLKKVLKTNPRSMLIIIGPEGGFDESEVVELERSGFLPISLGPRILRTELAPIYLLSAISYEVELHDEKD